MATTVLLTFMGALAVLDAEQNAPGANIRHFGDAVWWGRDGHVRRLWRLLPDHPRRSMGAAVLMFGGLVLLGAVAATLSSWLIDRVRSRHGDSAGGGSSSGSR